MTPLEAEQLILAYIESETDIFKRNTGRSRSEFPVFSREEIKDHKSVAHSWDWTVRGDYGEDREGITIWHGEYDITGPHLSYGFGSRDEWFSGNFPLVPGLLAVLVNYFLEKGYTPLADQKEKHNV